MLCHGHGGHGKVQEQIFYELGQCLALSLHNPLPEVKVPVVSWPSGRAGIFPSSSFDIAIALVSIPRESGYLSGRAFYICRTLSCELRAWP